MLTSSKLNSSTEASKDDSNEALNEEEVGYPLNEHRSPANETSLQSVIPDYPILNEELRTELKQLLWYRNVQYSTC